MIFRNNDKHLQEIQVSCGSLSLSSHSPPALCKESKIRPIKTQCHSPTYTIPSITTTSNILQVYNLLHLPLKILSSLKKSSSQKAYVELEVRVLLCSQHFTTIISPVKT